MSEFFNPTKFSSFKRQLNLYDFKRITHGADSGAYYHEMFLRSKPVLAMKMSRRKIKGQIRVSTYVRKEPEFYSMPFMGPIFDDAPRHSSVEGFRILPARMRRNKERFHSDEQRQQERSMSSTILFGARGYLDTRRDAGGRSLSLPFPDIQSGRMMASPCNDFVLSDQLYYQSLYNMLPSAPQQYFVQNDTTLQVRKRHLHQNAPDCPLLLPMSSQQYLQGSNKRFMSNSHHSAFKQIY